LSIREGSVSPDAKNRAVDYIPIEDTPVYACACALADELWDIVGQWDSFAKRVVGGQLIRAADSIAANLVEGDGRGSAPDAVRFFLYARASAREARHWLRRAADRKLIRLDLAGDIERRLIETAKSINGLIKYRRESAGKVVREAASEYPTQTREEPCW
jgi:four helix bundle protein